MRLNIRQENDLLDYREGDKGQTHLSISSKKELSATTFYLQLSSETKKHFAVTGFLRPFLAALVAAALSAGLL